MFRLIYSLSEFKKSRRCEGRTGVSRAAGERVAALGLPRCRRRAALVSRRPPQSLGRASRAAGRAAQIYAACSRRGRAVQSFEMTEDGKFRIEKFDGTDFSWWKMQIEDLLVQKDLDVVLGDKPEKMSDADWAGLDRKAMSVIRLSLTKNVAFNILKEKTAKGIMEALSNMYEKPSAANKVFLIRELKTFWRLLSAPRRRAQMMGSADCLFFGRHFTQKGLPGIFLEKTLTNTEIVVSAWSLRSAVQIVVEPPLSRRPLVVSARHHQSPVLLAVQSSSSLHSRNMPLGALALMIALCFVFGDRRLEDDTPTGSHLLGMRRKEQRRCGHLYRNRGRSIGSHQSSWHPPSKTRKIGVAVTRMPLLAPRTPVVHCLFARLKRALVKVERLLTCTLRTHTHTKKHDGKTYINKKAEEVSQNYVAMQEAVREEGLNVTPDEMFLSTVGGHDAKNRVHGVGDLARSLPRMHASEARRASTSSMWDPRDDEIRRLREELDEIRTS
ncbi:unnamed protein product [Cuscuta campestris]|uniref:Uncharacterized protein n=1 Tax=Cuscuta campestris TaxID=132261 RepID=A0A484MXJ7_9ASTE|nr:unnamed protein product [Cuscuta campestris]